MKRKFLNLFLCLSLIVVGGAMLDATATSTSSDSIVKPLKDLPFEV